MSNIITICGFCARRSFNRMLANALRGLALPAGMTITASPSIGMPLYNADVRAQAGRCRNRSEPDSHPCRRWRDHPVTPGYHDARVPGGLECNRLGVAHARSALRQQAGRAAIGLYGAAPVARACNIMPAR